MHTPGTTRQTKLLQDSVKRDEPSGNHVIAFHYKALRIRMELLCKSLMTGELR